MSAFIGLRGSRLLLSATLVLSLLTLGCYTVIHHSQSMHVDRKTSYDVDVQGGGDRYHPVDDNACSNCHYDSEWLGYYDHPLIYGSAGYYMYDWWYDYYQRPWWYDYDTMGEGFDGAGSSGTGRSTWTQRSLRRGEQQEVNTTTTGPKLSPGGSGGAAIGSSGQGTSPSEPKADKPPAPSYGKKKRNPRR